MNPLLLSISLLLPWVAGALALHPLRQRLSLTPAGWLGYGYFLGATLITASAFLAWQLPWLATAKGLLCCPAMLALGFYCGARWLARRLPIPEPLILPTASSGQRWLTVLLVTIIALHLGIAAWELYLRPVYPWDAWQTWMYTAKAWYFNGAPVDIVSSEHWLSQTDTDNYTAQGHRYPWLLPAQSWWLASLVGSWQDNLAGWPTMSAAIALGLALWGQAVAATSKRLLGPLAALLLLSLPLLNTHISLAGYADLWLAGFSGLGLIALARGLLESHWGQLLLGIIALALGLLVKHDAIIWLTCGLIVICLLKLRLRTSVVILALAGALLLSILAFGFWRFELQLNSDFVSYGQLLWLADSWHLLWYLLPAALLLALLPRTPTRATAKIISLIFATLFASQLVLFCTTNAGSWVGTASSRLLLQVSPVFIFALVYLASSIPIAAPSGHKWRSFLAVLTGTVCFLLLFGVWLLIDTSNGEYEPEANLDLEAQQLQVVYGSMHKTRAGLLLPPGSDRHAVLSTGPVRFNAENLEILNVDIEGTGRSKQTLFWRTKTRPTEPFSREFIFGAGPIMLSDDSNWQGEIIEIGIVLYANPKQPLVLHGLELEAATPHTLLDFIASDWATPEYWDQTSVNRTELSATPSLPSLPLLAGLWVLFCWIALLVFNKRPAAPMYPMLGVALIAWLAVDARWLHNSYHQALVTQAHYADTSNREALESANDAANMEFAQQLREQLGPEPQRVIVVEAGDHHKFISRRLKYALLPHAVYVNNGRLPRKRAAVAGAVIWLTDGQSSSQTNCPKPLQKVKPSLITPLGVLCKQPPNAE